MIKNIILDSNISIYLNFFLIVKKISILLIISVISLLVTASTAECTGGNVIKNCYGCDFLKKTKSFLLKIFTGEAYTIKHDLQVIKINYKTDDESLLRISRHENGHMLHPLVLQTTCISKELTPECTQKKEDILACIHKNLTCSNINKYGVILGAGTHYKGYNNEYCNSPKPIGFKNFYNNIKKNLQQFFAPAKMPMQIKIENTIDFKKIHTEYFQDKNNRENILLLANNKLYLWKITKTFEEVIILQYFNGLLINTQTIPYKKEDTEPVKSLIIVGEEPIIMDKTTMEVIENHFKKKYIKPKIALSIKNNEKPHPVQKPNQLADMEKRAINMFKTHDENLKKFRNREYIRNKKKNEK